MKKLTIDQFHITQYVSWGELEHIFGKRDYKAFLAWHEGKTSYRDGVHISDLEDYLKNIQL